MTFDDDEIDLIRCALERFRIEMATQCADAAGYARVTASAWFACMRFTLPRLEALIKRIDEYKKDRRNGDA